MLKCAASSDFIGLHARLGHPNTNTDISRQNKHFNEVRLTQLRLGRDQKIDFVYHKFTIFYSGFYVVDFVCLRFE